VQHLEFDPTENEKVVAISESGCWLWTGALTEYGYGRIGAGYVHRLSYQSSKGTIPSGMCVCHTCDVRSCVNPEHLWLGTISDNTADRDKKGRHVAHSDGGPKRHSDETVRSIYLDARDMRSIAADFGVSVGYVSFVKQKKTRKSATLDLPDLGKAARGRKPQINRAPAQS
jgi:hypothetical protein